jgi:hypothetical protein
MAQSAENDRPRLPEEYRLTDDESALVRRYFAGEVSVDELTPLLERRIQYLIDTGSVIPPGETRAQ